jgi:hypothetical protein
MCFMFPLYVLEHEDHECEMGLETYVHYLN